MLLIFSRGKGRPQLSQIDFQLIMCFGLSLPLKLLTELAGILVLPIVFRPRPCQRLAFIVHPVRCHLAIRHAAPGRMSSALEDRLSAEDALMVLLGLWVRV
jgi:hypothetical protein